MKQGAFIDIHYPINSYTICNIPFSTPRSPYSRIFWANFWTMCCSWPSTNHNYDSFQLFLVVSYLFVGWRNKILNRMHASLYAHPHLHWPIVINEFLHQLVVIQWKVIQINSTCGSLHEFPNVSNVHQSVITKFWLKSNTRYVYTACTLILNVISFSFFGSNQSKPNG